MKKSNDGKGPARKSISSTSSSGRSRPRHYSSPRRSSAGQGSRSHSAPRPKTCGPLCPGAFCAGAPLARKQINQVSVLPANTGQGSQQTEQSKLDQTSGVPSKSDRTSDNIAGLVQRDSFGIQVSPETAVGETTPMRPGYMELTAPDFVQDNDLAYYIPAGIFHKDELHGVRIDDNSLISIDEIVLHEEHRTPLEQQGVLALTAPEIISEEQELIQMIRKSIDAGRFRPSVVGASPVHGSPSPVHGSPSPVRGTTSPVRGSAPPSRGSAPPSRGSASPHGRESPSPLARAQMLIKQAMEEDARKTEVSPSSRYHACAKRSYWARLAAEGLLCPAVQGLICRGSPVTGHKSHHTCERRVNIDDDQNQNPETNYPDKKKESIDYMVSKGTQVDRNLNDSRPNLARVEETKDINVQEMVSGGDAATGFTRSAMATATEEQEIARLTAPDMIEEEDLNYWIPAGIFHKDTSPVIQLNAEHVSPGQVTPTKLSPVFLPPHDTPVGRTLEDKVIRALSSPAVTTEEELIKALTAPGVILEEELSRKSSSEKPPINLDIPQNPTTLATALVGQNAPAAKKHSVAFHQPDVATKTTTQNAGVTAHIPESSAETGTPVGVTARKASEDELGSSQSSDTEQLPPGPGRWKRLGPGAVISQPSEMWCPGLDAPEPDTQHMYSHVAPLNQIYPRAYSSGLGRGLQISIPKIVSRPLPQVDIKEFEKRQLSQVAPSSSSSGIFKIVALGACILLVLIVTGLTILKL